MNGRTGKRIQLPVHGLGFFLTAPYFLCNKTFLPSSPIPLLPHPNQRRYIVEWVLIRSGQQWETESVLKTVGVFVVGW